MKYKQVQDVEYSLLHVKFLDYQASSRRGIFIVKFEIIKVFIVHDLLIA